jgi:hypothetical protein
MTTPTPPPNNDDPIIQLTTGLADTPLGQRLAITITAILGKDAATQVADAIHKTAQQMSSTRLIVATPGNGTNQQAELP